PGVTGRPGAARPRVRKVSCRRRAGCRRTPCPTDRGRSRGADAHAARPPPLPTPSASAGEEQEKIRHRTTDSPPSRHLPIITAEARNHADHPPAATAAPGEIPLVDAHRERTLHRLDLA